MNHNQIQFIVNDLLFWSYEFKYLFWLDKILPSSPFKPFFCPTKILFCSQSFRTHKTKKNLRFSMICHGSLPILIKCFLIFFFSIKFISLLESLFQLRIYFILVFSAFCRFFYVYPLLLLLPLFAFLPRLLLLLPLFFFLVQLLRPLPCGILQ